MTKPFSKPRLIKITPRTILLVFKSYRSLIAYNLRIQEYSEHPEFSGKIFTVNQYKEWTRKNAKDKSGSEDWVGCFVTEGNIKPFWEGKFPSLTKEEKYLLSILSPYRGEGFSCISVKEGDSAAFRHEMAHVLFETDQEYKSRALSIIKDMRIDTREWIKEGLLKIGYARKRVKDETQAYVMDGIQYFIHITSSGSKVSKAIRADFAKSKRLFDRLFKSKTRDIPNLRYLSKKKPKVKIDDKHKK